MYAWVSLLFLSAPPSIYSIPPLPLNNDLSLIMIKQAYHIVYVEINATLWIINFFNLLKEFWHEWSSHWNHDGNHYSRKILILKIKRRQYFILSTVSPYLSELHA